MHAYGQGVASPLAGGRSLARASACVFFTRVFLSVRARDFRV
jgi:hypothetical protein